jgi:hypothetical protein
LFNNDAAGLAQSIKLHLMAAVVSASSCPTLQDCKLSWLCLRACVQGTASQWDWRRVQQQLLNVHLSTPGLQLRLLSKLEEAATHLINTTRVRQQQERRQMHGTRHPELPLLSQQPLSPGQAHAL